MIFFVSKIGNNQNSGSEESPLATIQFAVNQAAPGDTIIVNGGFYNELIDIRTRNITIIGKPGEEVVIDGRAGIGGVNAGLPQSGLQKKNTGPSATGMWRGWPIRDMAYTYAALVDVMASGVTIKNIKIWRSLGRGMRVWEFENNTRITDITLENVEIRQTRSQTIHIHRVDRFLVKNCKFIEGEENAPYHRPTKERNWGPSFAISESTDGLIVSSEIWGGWGEGLFIQHKKPRVINGKVATCYNITVKNCLLYGFRKGSLVTMATIGIKIIGNFISSPVDYIPHTGSPGTTIEGVEPQLNDNRGIHNVLVQDNIVVGNGSNLVFRLGESVDSSNIIIDHNTFANGQSSGIGLTGWLGDFGPGNEFTNNIIVQKPGVRCVGDNGPAGIADNWEIHNNIWTNMDINADKGWFKNGIKANGADVLVNPFAKIEKDTMKMDNYKQKPAFIEYGARGLNDTGPIDPLPEEKPDPITVYATVSGRDVMVTWDLPDEINFVRIQEMAPNTGWHFVEKLDRDQTSLLIPNRPLEEWGEGVWQYRARVSIDDDLYSEPGPPSSVTIPEPIDPLPPEEVETIKIEIVGPIDVKVLPNE